MIGKIRCYNGNYGFITDFDGNDYFFHKSVVVGRTQNCRQGRAVEFEVSDQEEPEAGKYPIAGKLFVIPGWIPQHTKDGYWVPAIRYNDPGKFRCSSCGCTTEAAVRKCPHCGVSMNRKQDDLYVHYIDTLIESRQMSAKEFEEWVFSKYGF